MFDAGSCFKIKFLEADLDLFGYVEFTCPFLAVYLDIAIQYTDNIGGVYNGAASIDAKTGVVTGASTMSDPSLNLCAIFGGSSGVPVPGNCFNIIGGCQTPFFNLLPGFIGHANASHDFGHGSGSGGLNFTSQITVTSTTVTIVLNNPQGTVCAGGAVGTFTWIVTLSTQNTISDLATNIDALMTYGYANWSSVGWNCIGTVSYDSGGSPQLSVAGPYSAGALASILFLPTPGCWSGFDVAESDMTFTSWSGGCYPNSGCAAYNGGVIPNIYKISTQVSIAGPYSITTTTQDWCGNPISSPTVNYTGVYSSPVEFDAPAGIDGSGAGVNTFVSIADGINNCALGP